MKCPSCNKNMPLSPTRNELDNDHGWLTVTPVYECSCGYIANGETQTVANASTKDDRDGNARRHR